MSDSGSDFSGEEAESVDGSGNDYSGEEAESVDGSEEEADTSGDDDPYAPETDGSDEEEDENTPETDIMNEFWMGEAEFDNKDMKKALEHFQKAMKLESECFGDDEKKQSMDQDELPCTFKSLIYVCRIHVLTGRKSTKDLLKTWANVLTLLEEKKAWIANSDEQNAIDNVVLNESIGILHGDRVARALMVSVLMKLPDNQSRFDLLGHLAYAYILPHFKSSSMRTREIVDSKASGNVATKSSSEVVADYDNEEIELIKKLEGTLSLDMIVRMMSDSVLIKRSRGAEYKLMTIQAMIHLKNKDMFALRSIYRKIRTDTFREQAIVDDKDKSYLSLTLGMMLMIGSNWKKAETQLSNAVDAFDSNSKMAAFALRLLVLTNLISASKSDPFNRSNARSLLNAHKSASALQKLRDAFENNDIKAFSENVCNGTGLYDDPFATKFKGMAKQSLEKKLILDLAEPFETISLAFLAKELGKDSTDDLSELMASLILDGDLIGRIDQVNMTFVKIASSSTSSKNAFFTRAAGWNDGLSAVQKSIISEMDTVSFEKKRGNHRGPITGTLWGDMGFGMMGGGMGKFFY